MKKVVSFLIALIIISFAQIPNIYADYIVTSNNDFIHYVTSKDSFGNDTILYTLFGNLETVYTENNVSVSVRRYLIDCSDYYKNLYDSLSAVYLDDTCSMVEVGGVDMNSTFRYNCHSFAWYSDDPLTNPYWMDSPDAYYSGSSPYYTEVFIPQTGDKICYFNSNGNNVHSGIIIEISSGVSNGAIEGIDLIKVKSKWGRSGLFEHAGDHCPYIINPVPGDTITDIKYFRHHTHSFTSSYTSNGASNHEAYCACGAHVTQGHTLNYSYTNQYYHGVSCADCSYSAQVGHDWVLSGIWYMCLHCPAKHRVDDGPLPTPYSLDPVTE